MKESVEQVFHEGNFNLFHAIDEDYTINFQCHNFIEVYLSLSGGKHFIIGDTVYNMQRGDLFVCNDLEVHRIITQQGVLYERYWWEFIPSFAYGFCTEQTNLLHYVYERTPDFSHRVSLNPTQLEEILYLIYRYEALSQPDSRKIYGSDVQLDLLRVEMLLFFAKAFHTPSAREIRPTTIEYNDTIYSIMHYIRQNISKSLTLDDIAMNVGVNKYHMCKVFKASTGSTINHYIIACRISRAKDLLQEGRSVTDACYDSGFHNLSHFIRTFHTNVGITPGKYVQEKEEEKARLMSIHFHTP